MELAAPGMKKDDFNINIDNDGNLHIKMEQKNEKKDENKKEHYLRREFSYSKFEQTLILPHSVKRVGQDFFWFVVNFCHKPIILRKSVSCICFILPFFVIFVCPNNTI